MPLCYARNGEGFVSEQYFGKMQPSSTVETSRLRSKPVNERHRLITSIMSGRAGDGDQLLTIISRRHPFAELNRSTGRLIPPRCQPLICICASPHPFTTNK